MKAFAQNLRRRKLSLALGTSALAIFPVTARAQCAPDPTIANATSSCTGIDSNGIRITTPGSTLTVTSGATVTNSGAPAITVEVPNSLSSIQETITVAGQVTGGAQSGIALYTGPVATYNGSTTRLALTIAAGAGVSGVTAFDVRQSAGNTYGQLTISVDNAGTITGSSGVALRGDLATTSNGFTTASSAFSSFTNRASGVISGSIVGPVASLTNAGLIDGGSGAALTTGNAGTAYPYTINPGAWNNSGTIRSNSAAATLSSATISTLTNSGTILNTGTGAAVSGNFLSLTNQSGGTISSGGATAISGVTTLVNGGTITGNVVGSNGTSLIDSSQGRITGSVTLGSYDDTLVVRYAGTPALVTGITGTINPGGGTNTEQVAVTSDTTINTPVTLLAGFQQFGISTATGATTTLGAGFVAPGTVQVYGGGTLVNRATVVAAGPAFALNGVTSPGVQRFVNAGTIQTTSASAAAISAQSGAFTTISNTGAIVSAGSGVSTFQASVANSGTIDSVGTGVSLSGNSLTNSGQIRSSGGIGALLSGNVGTASSNSGTIRGATIGVETSAFLTNTGTITATNPTGTAVVLDPYGAVYNLAGGVIGNGGRAVTGTSFNEVISNAGTINGTVTLSSSFANGGSQRYISSGTGVLNGNLVLGADGVLFTDLANSGPGPFAGITGTVTAASGAQLRYRASGTQSATIGPVGPFATPTFELTSGAKLTLGAAAPVTQRLLLAGTGSVDLTANFTASTAQGAIGTTQTLSDRPGYSGAASALAITSRGTIAFTRDPAAAVSAAAAVSLGNGDTFTNLGTITVTDHTPAPSFISASSGGAVVNAGAILLDGGIGVTGTSLVNTGSITQIAGGVNSAGVRLGVSSGSIVNSGLISVGGAAIAAYYNTTVTNTGTIASTGGVAIGGTDTSASATIVNAAGGTISGTGGTAIRLYNGTATNAGTISGTVDLGYGYPYYSGAPLRSFSSSVYVAAGGTVAGDVLFGSGPDLLLQTSDTLGVSGMIDGGAGTDIYGRQLSTSGTVALDLPANVVNFEDRLVQAIGTDTVVTTIAAAPVAGNLYSLGTGSVVNQATIAGMLTTTTPPSNVYPYNQSTLFPSAQILSSLTNAGTVGGGVQAQVGAFSNSGTVSFAGSTSYGATVSLYGTPSLAFANSGTITAKPIFWSYAVALTAGDTMRVANSGRILGGGVSMDLQSTAGTPIALTFANTGTIASSNGTDAMNVTAGNYGTGAGGTLALDNSGTISTQGGAASNGSAQTFGLYAYDATQPLSYAIANSGTISATTAQPTTAQSTALIVAGAGLSGTITNAVSGVISASGGQAVGVLVADSALNLVNAGTISASGTTSSQAILTFDAFNNTVRNSGTITGDVVLADGADTLDNAGTINGRVTLGAGDDTVIQRVGGRVTGLVDGGAGTDRYTVDTTGGTATLAAAQIANFESLTQTGSGTGSYSGNFMVDSIGLAGGALAVASGHTLSTVGATTVTGVAGSGALTLINAGAITGGVTLADGNDMLINTGTIAGPVALGAGDDMFVEGAGSRAGSVDGGTGTNLYRVALAGDRSGIGARSNFQALAVDGTGTLTLGLDQNFQTITLNGANLTLALNGRSVGQIVATGSATRLTLDGDVGAVQLGAGNDVLAIGASLLKGRYDGGAGSDTLRLTAPGGVTLAGSATGFELVTAIAPLTVTGTLGTAGATLGFTGGDTAVTVGRGGVLAGTIDLGAGNDRFRLAAGGSLLGSVSGGAGSNAATLELAGDTTLAAGVLTNFQRLTTEGSGTLTLAGGAFAYDALTAIGGLTVANTASLTGAVTFGPADNRFVIAGGFTGSVDGGAGSDSIDVASGTAAAPVAFTNVSNVEAYRMSGGFATVSGTASFGNVTLTGGRLVELAGSVLNAANVSVGAGAIFGSAGTLNGNLAVAGTLSPGASPGTMTVNGNVALAGGSLSLFELSSTVSDKLVVNGAVTIASGATLQLVPVGTLRPGTLYDLIVASGGIAGSFTTVLKPDSVFGFLVQRADRIQLLGQFLDAGGFTPQVSRSIAYANATLVTQPATSALFGALPLLLNADGSSNAAAFARITPEPYAMATQIGVDNALTLTGVARGPAFATTGDTVHPYTFAATLGQRHQLGDAASGAAAARVQGYGFLGGIGIGSVTWSVGAFGGYLDDTQRIDALATRTKADGLVAGIHGRYETPGGFGFTASVLYDGGAARTTRMLPGGSAATGRYDLHSWVGDAQLSYELVLHSGWALRPHAGVTYVRTTRSGVAEDSASPFALTVARDRHVAGFADTGITFGRSAASPAPFRPWVSFGLRYQTQGTRVDALAGYSGGALALEAQGASRTRAVGTAEGGLAYRLMSGLDLFASAASQTGNDDHQESVTVGARMRF